MNKRPIIAIPLDWQDQPTYSKHHSWYALRTNYTEEISKAGGTPITLSYDHKSIENYINLADGLLISGGAHDINPSLYGEEKGSYTKEIKQNRTDFEITMIKAALAKRIPILGICAGEQLLSVVFEGKLIQDIGTHVENALEHEQKDLNKPLTQPHHSVKITPNTLLYRILHKDEIEVNSSHHQAVKSVGPEMIISAIAPDNVIEAVEVPGHDFVMGVAWHPEYIASENDSLIFQAFVKAARQRK